MARSDASIGMTAFMMSIASTTSKIGRAVILWDGLEPDASDAPPPLVGLTSDGRRRWRVGLKRDPLHLSMEKAAFALAANACF